MPSPSRTVSHPRDPALEALRGIAALIVVAWHFLFAFMPDILDYPNYGGIAGTPLMAFFNGTSAVTIFFVLSGYVLTKPYFETGHKRVLILGVCKRWLRLSLPVFLSVMLSWVLFSCHLYFYEEAAALSGSNWLKTFGFAMVPPFEPGLGAAFLNGLLEPFQHNNNAFNPPLWTMAAELLGSYIAFALAAMLLPLRKKTGLVILVCATVSLIAFLREPFLIGFVAGVLLAFYAPKLEPMKGGQALFFLMLGIVGLGYRGTIGFYTVLETLGYLVDAGAIEPVRALFNTLGAVSVMLVFIRYEPWRRWLAKPLSRWLGLYSFPIYLVHFLVFCSCGAAVFVQFAQNTDLMTARLASLAVSLPIVFAVATVFVAIDRRWVTYVNQLFRGIKI